MCRFSSLATLQLIFSTNKLKSTLATLTTQMEGLQLEHMLLIVSGGARDFFLQVVWGCSAFYRGCYEIRVIAYVSHGSLLQHLPTISSYLFTCLLSEASLWSMKSAIHRSYYYYYH